MSDTKTLTPLSMFIKDVDEVIEQYGDGQLSEKDSMEVAGLIIAKRIAARRLPDERAAMEKISVETLITYNDEENIDLTHGETAKLIFDNNFKQKSNNG